jgi:hypothetical protein
LGTSAAAGTSALGTSLANEAGSPTGRLGAGEVATLVGGVVAGLEAEREPVGAGVVVSGRSEIEADPACVAGVDAAVQDTGTAIRHAATRVLRARTARAS